MPRFSILHPSVRPDKVAQVRDCWRAEAVAPDSIEYILAHHASQAFDGSLADIHCVNQGRDHPTLNGRSSFVANVNLAASRATGDYLVCIADDLYPCARWDRLLAEALPDANQEAILGVDDGPEWEKRLRHPVMTRARYRRQGWLFCPEYTGVFCDDDLHQRALLDNVRVEAPQIRFEHRHPFFDQRVPDDDWYRLGNSTAEYRRGRWRLRWRRLRGFPLAGS